MLTAMLSCSFTAQHNPIQSNPVVAWLQKKESLSVLVAAFSLFSFYVGSSRYAATWCSPFLVIRAEALLM